MRTIAALDGKVGRAVDLRRHGRIRGRKNLSEPLAVAVMHRRDHAQQTRVGRGIVDETADENFEQGRREAHPIFGNLQLWRHGDDQRCLSEPGHRLSVGSRQVGIGGGTGLIGGAISEERVECVGNVGRVHRPRVRRIDRIEYGRAHGLGMQCDQCRGDGRAVGFSVDVPALESKRPPHPSKSATVTLVPKSFSSKPRAVDPAWHAA